MVVYKEEIAQHEWLKVEVTKKKVTIYACGMLDCSALDGSPTKWKKVMEVPNVK